MSDPEPPASPDLSFYLSAGIALVAALVLVRNLLPAKRDLSDTIRRREDLEREKQDLAEERSRLGLERKALEDDPVYQERLLRKQTGMTRPGEFLVR